MKKLVLLFVLFAFLFSCSKKESDIKDLTPKKNNNTTAANTGEVQFQPQMIDLVNGNVNARLEAADAATILVTIEDDKGVVVKNKVSIKLTNFNGSYISQPLVLKDGIYKLKEFLVLDAASNVLYATPLTGSALAGVVTTPLPMTFTVINQKLSTVIPQVVSTLTKTAGNFGYLTFNFAVVETLDFNLAIFAFNKTTVAYDLVTSDVTLKNGTIEMYKGTFPANIEAISIKDEKAGTYTLTVAKTGYKTYTGTYTYADLKAGFDDPINVILEEEIAPLTTFTDPRDGKVYKIVTIGSQIWMAENLAYLPQVDEEINSTPYGDVPTESKYYIYGQLPIIGTTESDQVLNAKNTLNYQTYGTLYNLHSSKNACPSGWHLPSNLEWLLLLNYLGGEDVAQNKLKEAGTIHWASPNTGATNESGFTALPGGGGLRAGMIIPDKMTGAWWLSDGFNVSSGTVKMLLLNHVNSINIIVDFQAQQLGSVRCIKD